MPRYFFDLFVNGETSIDREGTDFLEHHDVRREAMNLLPSVAKDEVVRDGDRQAFTVLVRNSDGRAVYTATLSYAGLWLDPKASDRLAET